MSDTKLMKPLFRGYRFNAKGTKMRAVSSCPRTGYKIRLNET